MDGNLQGLVELTNAECRNAEYSAQRLADLAGITPRTLHHYDEIELLVPAIRMGNGRRLYHADQVVRLCQILWLRGLGFSLDRIRAILNNPSLNTTAVLRTQQRLVRQEILRMQGVECSIERAIQHLEGLPMSKGELERVLKDSAELQPNFAQNFEQMIDQAYGEGWYAKAKSYTDTLNADQMAAIQQRNWDWTLRFMLAARQGLAPHSEEVQALIHEGVVMADEAQVFPATTKESFLKGREAIKPGSAMTKPLEGLCPGYAQLYYDASGIYAENRWPVQS